MYDALIQSQWGPVFASHKDYNENFPAWGGYSDLIIKKALEEDFSDFTSDESIDQSPKSTTTRTPQICFVPILEEEFKSRPIQPVCTKQPAVISAHQNITPEARHSVKRQPKQQTELESKQTTNVSSSLYRKSPIASTTNSLSSSQNSAHSSKTKSLPPSWENDHPSGSFITQVRVNRPMSWKEKAQSSNATKPFKEKPDPEVQIQKILLEMEELKSKVEQFTGTSSTDKEYRLLDELLTRLMLKLDDVNTDGEPALRQKRKMAVKAIQHCIATLERQLSHNESIMNVPSTDYDTNGDV